MTAPKPTDDTAAAAEQEAPTRRSPYTDVLRNHPDWTYLFDGSPTRAPTEDEAAEYARRLHDPQWADIYSPPAFHYHLIGAAS